MNVTTSGKYKITDTGNEVSITTDNPKGFLFVKAIWCRNGDSIQIDLHTDSMMETELMYKMLSETVGRR